MEGRRVKDRNRQRKSRKKLERKEGALSQELGELGLGDHSYPMYNHEPVPTMYANPTLYHAKDGKRHVTSYYHLLRDIAKLNGGNGMWKILAQIAPQGQEDTSN